MNEMLKVLQLAYRKHHLGDESIGWDELGNSLYDVLASEMGDEEFIEWLHEVKRPRSPILPCLDCGKPHRQTESCKCTHQTTN